MRRNMVRFSRSLAATLLAGCLAAVIFLPDAGRTEEGDDPSDLAGYDARIEDSDRQHWAFQPIRRPEVPAVDSGDWVRNPIDAFVLAGLEAKGWKPAPPAQPRALVRRMYLDVVGLPPTPAEQEQFLADPAPEAADRLAD